MDAYAQNFPLEQLVQHYEALLGPAEALPSAGALRAEIVAALRGTEFDEHAYVYADAATLAATPTGQPAQDAVGGTQGAADYWPFGVVPTAPPWGS